MIHILYIHKYSIKYQYLCVCTTNSEELHHSKLFHIKKFIIVLIYNQKYEK